MSPYQAHYVKNSTLIDVSGGQIDTSKPYWLFGHNGKKIAVFFYDPYISNDIAFQHLLRSADKFAERIRNAYGNRNLVNIATNEKLTDIMKLLPICAFHGILKKIFIEIILFLQITSII